MGNIRFTISLNNGEERERESVKANLLVVQADMENCNKNVDHEYNTNDERKYEKRSMHIYIKLQSMVSVTL